MTGPVRSPSRIANIFQTSGVRRNVGIPAEADASKQRSMARQSRASKGAGSSGSEGSDVVRTVIGRYENGADSHRTQCAISDPHIALVPFEGCENLCSIAQA